MNVTMGYYDDPNSQMVSQLGSTLGAAGGMYFGGPVGGALGGAAGGALGKLFGGGKKKKQAKVFPIGTKENPGWPGVGGNTIIMDGGGEGQSRGGSALSGGMGGLMNGVSMVDQFGGPGSGMPQDFGSSPLGSMFGMNQIGNQPGYVPDNFNSSYFLNNMTF